MYFRNIVECVLNTGMQKGEMLSLKWGQIRDGFIYLHETKPKEASQIPVNDDLERMFKQIIKKQHLTSKYVLLDEGKPVKGVQ